MFKKKIGMISLIAFTSFAQIGCPNSPILNHVKASKQKSLHASNKSGSDCPIFLKEENLCASISEFEFQKSESEPGHFTLKFWDPSHDSNGPYITPSNHVTVELWLLCCQGALGAPTQVTQVKDSTGYLVPGVFKVTNVYFFKKGSWEFRIQVTQGDGGSILSQGTQKFKY